MQFSQHTCDEPIVGIDSQRIDPVLGVLPHVFVEHADYSKCQRKQGHNVQEFESCDHEQAVAMPWATV